MPSGYDLISTLDKTQKKAYGKLPGQMVQNNPLYQTGSRYLQGLYDENPADIEAMEAPYQRRYQQNVADLAEQFGGAGAISSSGFQKALSGATTDLSERLAALRANVRQNALPQLLQYAGAPYEQGMNLLQLNTQQALPKKRPWWQDAVVGLTGKSAGVAGSSLF